jgi:hypothetical protein
MVAMFSKELGAPVAGGVLHQGGKQEWAEAQLNPKKGRQGGVLGVSLTVKGVTAVETVKALVRWRLFRVPSPDKRQP